MLSKILEQHPTMRGRGQAGALKQPVSGEKRRLPVMGGTEFKLAHWLPGKLAEMHSTHCSFDKNSH